MVLIIRDRTKHTWLTFKILSFVEASFVKDLKSETLRTFKIFDWILASTQFIFEICCENKTIVQENITLKTQ